MPVLDEAIFDYFEGEAEIGRSFNPGLELAHTVKKHDHRVIETEMKSATC